MYAKEELEIIKGRLLNAIYSHHTLKVREIQYKPSIDDVEPYSINWFSKVILEGKVIANIRDQVVRNINFNGRYDYLIKFIFQSLDVELHKFGSSWMGYPNEEPLPISYPMVAIGSKLLPEEIAEQELSRIKAEQFKVQTMKAWQEAMITNTPNFPTGGGAGISTIGRGTMGTFGNITTTFTIPSFYYSHDIDRSAILSEVVPQNANPPREEAVTQALASGVSQLELDRLRRSGRLYGR